MKNILGLGLTLVIGLGFYFLFYAAIYSLQSLASPCGMTWAENGQALDREDCAYMGGEGWE